MNRIKSKQPLQRPLKQPQSFDIFKAACVGMFPIFNVCNDIKQRLYIHDIEIVGFKPHVWVARATLQFIR